MSMKNFFTEQIYNEFNLDTFETQSQPIFL